MSDLYQKQSGQTELSFLDNPKLWTFLLTCLAFGTPFWIALISSFVSTTSGSGLLLFIVSLPVVAGYLIVGLISFGVGIWHASNARWAFAIPCTVVPAAVAMFIVFPGMYRQFESAADYVHFAIFSQSYQRAVDATPTTDGPRLLWFFWTDSSPPLAGQILRFLVFDESDELMLHNTQRSAAWRARYLRNPMAPGYVGGEQNFGDPPHHLMGHYYVVNARS